MSHRKFTIELQRIDVLDVTLEIWAENLSDAIHEARQNITRFPGQWNVDQGGVLIRKVTAHEAKEESK